ncbi:MAG: hypothetical protein ACLFN8_05485 [Candidatus Woesearchaeota archaeon]
MIFEFNNGFFDSCKLQVIRNHKLVLIKDLFCDLDFKSIGGSYFMCEESLLLVKLDVFIVEDLLFNGFSF